MSNPTPKQQVNVIFKQNCHCFNKSGCCKKKLVMRENKIHIPKIKKSKFVIFLRGTIGLFHGILELILGHFLHHLFGQVNLTSFSQSN